MDFKDFTAKVIRKTSDFRIWAVVYYKKDNAMFRRDYMELHQERKSPKDAR